MARVPDIVLYGASGHANAVRCCLEQGGFARVVAFIDDFQGDRGLTLGERPIISFDAWRERFLEIPCFIAVGNAPAKRRLAERISGAGGRFCNFHDRPGRTLPEVTIGTGTFIQSPSYVGPNSRIGAHVVVMTMSTIGHDVAIGDCCTVCPSATIGGHVVIEDEVFIGSGSVIINGSPERPILIGKGATIGAGAVVTKLVRAGAVVMGNPARPIRDLAKARRNPPRAKARS